jgi:hypothetical protein
MLGNVFRKKIRVRSVGTATSYELNGRAHLHSVQTGSGIRQASNSMGTESLSSKLKRLGRETDYSSPYSSDVRNGGAITPLPNISSWRNV